MPKKFKTIFIVPFVLLSIFIALQKLNINGAPPYGESLSEVPETVPNSSILDNWVRPDVPPRVGLQVGHWKNEELPKELEKLIGSTGATGGGKAEWEVNYQIAVETSKILKEWGIDVDIIPATVPENYWADAFIAIHADGSLDPYVSGFKVAGPWRNYRNNSDKLVNYLDKAYESSTGLIRDPNISRNMRGYYAFSWWRYDHAIHPMTSAAIVETGFLTNYSDRQIIIDEPELPARGIASGTLQYLNAMGLISEDSIKL